MVPRTSYYCPELTPDGPDIDNLLPSRMTIIKPLDGSLPRRIDDEWTTEPQPQHSEQWTGPTHIEEKPSYKKQLEEDEEDNQQAIKARATSMPKQPTEQEIMENNLTHMPYRSWCPICIQGRGRPDAHPQRSSSRPITQIDFACLKGFENQYPKPVLTAIDIETGLCSATLVPNKATWWTTVSTTSLPSSWRQAEHQQWFRVTTNHISRHWFKQYHQRYQASQPGIHQPAAPKAKAASRDCIELSLDKHVSSESTSEPTTGSMLACNTQSCHGSSSTALFSSTTTSSIAMGYQATSRDGSQTTRLPSASLEKAYSTCHYKV